jgi:hypothetical protein
MYLFTGGCGLNFKGLYFNAKFGRIEYPTSSIRRARRLGIGPAWIPRVSAMNAVPLGPENLFYGILPEGLPDVFHLNRTKKHGTGAAM